MRIVCLSLGISVKGKRPSKRFLSDGPIQKTVRSFMQIGCLPCVHIPAGVLSFQESWYRQAYAGQIAPFPSKRKEKPLNLEGIPRLFSVLLPKYAHSAGSSPENHVRRFPLVSNVFRQVIYHFFHFYAQNLFFLLLRNTRSL